MEDRYADKIHCIEKSAMGLDRNAIMEIISLERKLRQAIIHLMGSRYRDGAIDGATADQCLSDLNTYLDDRFGDSEKGEE